MTLDELLEHEGIALNWPLIVEFVAGWIEGYGGRGDPRNIVMALEWREEMLND